MKGGLIKKHRLFFKDFDGSLLEVPQKKIFLKANELKNLKKQAYRQQASVYGKIDVNIAVLCKKTHEFVRKRWNPDLDDGEEYGDIQDKEGGPQIGDESEGFMMQSQRLEGHRGTIQARDDNLDQHFQSPTMGRNRAATLIHKSTDEKSKISPSKLIPFDGIEQADDEESKKLI